MTTTKDLSIGAGITTTTTAEARTAQSWMASLSPAAGARALRLCGRSLLYVEDQQQLLELNATADLIWRSFADAGGAAAAIRDLAALGLRPPRARALVGEVARGWMLAGYLAPTALEGLLGRPQPDRTIVLHELAVELRLQDLPCKALDEVFGHLYAAAADAGARRLSAIRQGDLVLLYLERSLVLAGAAEGWVAAIKAVLTDLYLEAVAAGFLTHGALLAKGGRRLLLAGEPGAGKTTLALALAARGWAYGSDDIVRISPQASVTGAPFPAAVKPGSVPLLLDLWPVLRDLPPWLRPDGQQARYLVPSARMDDGGGDLDLFVTLARRPGEGASAIPISALDALSAIVDAACARRWRMNADALVALATSLERATCVRLEYDDLADAVTSLETLAGDEAQPS